MTLRFFVESSGMSILVTDDVLLTFAEFRQVGPKDKEAGGQLFARFQEREAIVVEATPPSRLDKRSRFGFEPNRWLQRCEINDRYEKGLHYIGDWHTHPEPIPAPSSDDEANTIECFLKSKHALKAFVMVIIGTDPIPRGLYVGLVSDGQVIPLSNQPGIAILWGETVPGNEKPHLEWTLPLRGT